MSAIQDLLNRAAIWRDETNPGANTAVLNGQLIIDIIETMQERTPIFSNSFYDPSLLPITQNPSIVTVGGQDVNEMVFVTFYIMEPALISDFRFYNSGLAFADPLKFAIYEFETFLNYDKIAATEIEFTTLSANAIQILNFDDDILLSPGQYLLALVGSDEWSPSVQNINSNIAGVLTNLNPAGSVGGISGAFVRGVGSTDLPASITIVSGDRTADQLHGAFGLV